MPRIIQIVQYNLESSETMNVNVNLDRFVIGRFLWES